MCQKNRNGGIYVGKLKSPRCFCSRESELRENSEFLTYMCSLVLSDSVHGFGRSQSYGPVEKEWHVLWETIKCVSAARKSLTASTLMLDVSNFDTEETKHQTT